MMFDDSVQSRVGYRGTGLVKLFLSISKRVIRTLPLQRFVHQKRMDPSEFEDLDNLSSEGVH
eukprot:m.149212 g.149212  ORF g.149212 m.149212 type:complete len:62 (-) comp14228_c0_seq1:1264-1449(-)